MNCAKTILKPKSFLVFCFICDNSHFWWLSYILKPIQLCNHFSRGKNWHMVMFRLMIEANLLASFPDNHKIQFAYVLILDVKSKRTTTSSKSLKKPNKQKNPTHTPGRHGWQNVFQKITYTESKTRNIYNIKGSCKAHPQQRALSQNIIKKWLYHALHEY